MTSTTQMLNTAEDANQALIEQLKAVVGRRQVLTSANDTERFRRGFRSGEGEALAVVKPATLLQLWQVLQACVDADKIVIMQAANTGLTEGLSLIHI